MTEVVIALGANLGNREANLRRAISDMVDADVRVVRLSSVWETEPVPPGQPRFLNAVAVAETDLSPAALLAALKGIEIAMGREQGPRWGPRPIDLDILFYGAERVETADLVIPHPRIAERAFVLAPLAEVIDGPLPVLGRTARDLLESAHGTGIKRTPFGLGHPPAQV